MYDKLSHTGLLILMALGVLPPFDLPASHMGAIERHELSDRDDPRQMVH